MNITMYFGMSGVRCALLRLVTLCVVAVGVVCSQSQPAWGQLFGARNVGSPIRSPFESRSNGTPAAAGVAAGTLDGSERFVRGNRSRNDFVGSDRNQQSGFVGAGQAIGVGRVRTATEGLRIKTTDTTRLNRPLPPQSRKGIYYPRLEIAFDTDVSEPSPELAAVKARVSERVTGVAGDNVELTIEGRTAFLTGAVSSHRAAELAEQLLRFEPGVDRVENNLRVEASREIVPLPRP